MALYVLFLGKSEEKVPELLKRTFFGGFRPFLAKKGQISKYNCDIWERCRASIFFTAKDMDLRNVMHIVVSPTNGTLILIWKQFFRRRFYIFEMCLLSAHTFFLIFRSQLKFFGGWTLLLQIMATCAALQGIITHAYRKLVFQKSDDLKFWKRRRVFFVKILKILTVFKNT